MGCGCNKKREKYQVVLKGGTTLTKSSETEAVKFAAKHPGAKVVKPKAA